VAHNPPEQKLLSDKITLEDGDMKKEYSNGEVTVVWEPGKCIHSGICVKTLPAVYNPEAKPWIKVENATTAELKEQIDTCPSGALTWYMNDEQAEAAPPTNATTAQVIADGPLLVNGEVEITHADGRREVKQKTTAFCRCGASKNKPYCDGNHRQIDFKG
jgi:uncharacterized Fe-S cluster protein YjdI